MKTYAASAKSNVTYVNQPVSLPTQPLSDIKPIVNDGVNLAFVVKPLIIRVVLLLSFIA